MKKVTLSIDASSSAVGYAYFDANNKLLASGSVHVDNKKVLWNERVGEIIEKFSCEVKKIEVDNGFKVKKLLMNLGYAQSNGVDTSKLGLKMVQDLIIYRYCVVEDAEYAPVLDSSWISYLKEFNEYEYSFNEIKKRKTKKLETVKAALSVRSGYSLKGIIVEYYKDPFYKYKYVKSAEGEPYSLISDDEADAIFAGYAFLNGKIADTTLLSRKEKNKLERIDTIKKELSKKLKRFNTLKEKVEKLNNEIKDIYRKQSVAQSKTNERSIKLRQEKISIAKEEMEKLHKEIKNIAEEGRKIQDEEI